MIDKSNRLASFVTLVATALAIFSPAPAAMAQPAAVMERFEIVEQRPAFDGASFGEPGPYRLIVAKAHLRVAPDHPANRAIVDLAHAPRLASGEVRYTADVIILRPSDPTHARRVLMAEIPNRGMKLVLPQLNGVDLMAQFAAPKGGATPVPFDRASAGNGFLFRRGYTLVWVGWQADVPANPSLLRADFPVATNNGKPITGRVQTAMVFDNQDHQSFLPLAYAAAPGAEASAELTVRARPGDPPHRLDRASWAFVSSRRIRIDRPANMDAGAIYEFVYTATDPIVAGLGFAATRDVIGWLRHSQSDAAGGANPLVDLRAASCAFSNPARCRPTAMDSVDLVIGSGASQSGRYLRDMLWQGFNNDGAGRRVFDGELVVVPGSRKSFTNRRWAEPGRFSRQHEDALVYGNQFPFGYAVTTDRLTGVRDGIFFRCRVTATCPKLFHIDGSSEFWAAGSSLVTTDGAGHDLALPDSVRAYMTTGMAHISGMVGASSQLAPNPLSSTPVLRALAIDLDQWLTKGTKPPASRWPSLARGELAPPARQDRVGFPAYAGLPYSGVANRVARTDYDHVPARSDPSQGWRILVPTTDADGNDRAGIRLPEIAVPRGTYLGWKPRKSGYAQGDISFLYGAYVPFAATKEARLAAGDPRLSIAERYTDEADYRHRLDAARKVLEQDRLYLDPPQ